MLNITSLPPITISLTTIKSRLQHLGVVLHSLTKQEIKPTRVLLTISEAPYLLDQGVQVADFPADVIRLIEEGLVEVLSVPNEGPYRKLLPALHRYRGEEHLIAVADDDTVYPPQWLTGLILTYMQKKCVIAYRCRAMMVEDGKFTRYSKWQLLPATDNAYGDVPASLHSLFTIATGVRGVLYNNRFFTDFHLLEDLRKLAPRQDDLAFKAATLCSGIVTTLVDPAAAEVVRFKDLRPQEALFDLNKKSNDHAWRSIIDYLSISGNFRLDKIMSSTPYSTER